MTCSPAVSSRAEIALQNLLDLLALPAGPGEEAVVADWVETELERMGIPARCRSRDQAQHQSEYGGSTGNLIVRLEGSRSEPRRLFSAHMDTVPLARNCKPRVVDGRDGERFLKRRLGGR